MELKSRVKKIRKECNIKTQKNLADILGVAESRIKSIESGRVKSVAPNELEILVEKFKLNPDWILVGAGDMYTNKDKDEKSLDEEVHYIRNVISDNLLDLPAFQEIIKNGDAIYKINQFIYLYNRFLRDFKTYGLDAPYNEVMKLSALRVQVEQAENELVHANASFEKSIKGTDIEASYTEMVIKPMEQKIANLNTELNKMIENISK